MEDPTSDPTSGDPPMTDAAFDYATIVLFTPFIFIPLSIIGARLVKYSWKIYQAKKYGFGDDLLEDPLAELGLKLNRNYDDTFEIRKLRKEKEKEQNEKIKRRESAIKRKQENERILQDSVQKPRRLSKYVPIHAAGEYLKNLKEKTEKTWYEKISPEAVRNWINMSGYAKIWMMLQVSCTFLAIVNYVALTYLASRDDRDERALIKNLDLLYASFFLLDYMLSFYIAEDRLLFYIQPMSLVDLMSIVSPFVYLFVASPTKYVWFIGFIRIFRATRILRTYRLLSFTQSEETRELTVFVLNFLNFIFFSASIINATEALNFTSEPPSLRNWHDSLYYIMVTFSTIGFGDLTPSSTISRIVVMFLIILVIIYIPWQTGKIIEIFNSMSKYQRAIYTAKSGISHVIITGDISYSAIINFCREYFMTDDNGSVIILHDQDPSIEIRRLLNHPFYRTKITYLHGNAMSLQDMKRAQAQYATGLFIITADSSSGASEEEEEIDAYEKDTQILLNALYAKTNFPGLGIFAQVNDYRSKELGAHCGIDRMFAIDEMKALLFANNCICPGVLPLVLNLINSYRDISDNISNKDFWTEEYQCGLVSQIQSFKIPSGLVGVSYSEFVKEIFNYYNCVVFALVSINSGFNQNPVRFKIEKDYKLRVDDIAFCIGDGTDELLLRIALQFKEYSPQIEIESMSNELGIEMEGLVSPKLPEVSPFLLFPNEEADTRKVKSEGKLISPPENLKDHVILAGYMSARVILQFIKNIRERRAYEQASNLGNSAHKNTSILIILEQLPDQDNLGIMWKEILTFHSIYVLKGRVVQKTVLERAGISRCNCFVVFSRQGEESVKSDAHSVFLVKLIQKEYPKIKFLIELINGSNVKYFSSRKLEWDTSNLRMQSIINNYALSNGDRQLLYRSFRQEGYEKSTLVYQILQFLLAKPDKPSAKLEKKSSRAAHELIKKSKTNVNDEDDLAPLREDEGIHHKKEQAITEVYLERALEQAEANDDDLAPFPAYHFDKYFASGMVTSSTFLLSLLCQSYFSPYILDIVKGLVENTYLLPLKKDLEGKQYYEVAYACLSQGYTPLGLLRNANQDKRMGDEMPYVYTNCRHGDVVNSKDMVFVLKTWE